MSAQTKVLVTGFGPFLNITQNPSWKIAHSLPSTLDAPNGSLITVIVPAEPTPAAYHKIADQTHSLIETHKPDLIVHLGLDVESPAGVFKIEKSAPKEGYHDVPDVERKVITRAENKQLFGKLPVELATTLDVGAARAACQDACGWLSLPLAKGKNACEAGGRPCVDVQVTDEVGTYVCGFQYYMSLLGMEKATGRRDVVFLHVPRLESEAEVKVGVRVVEELIEALVGGMKV